VHFNEAIVKDEAIRVARILELGRDIDILGFQFIAFPDKGGSKTYIEILILP
jgi:hypothetical protein